MFSVTLNKFDIISFCRGANTLKEITLTSDDGVEYNGKSMVALRETMVGNSEDFMCLIKDADNEKTTKFIDKWRNN